MRVPRKAVRPGYGWVRCLPLLGAVGFVWLLHVPQLRPAGLDWAAALLSASLVLLGGRFPVAVAFTQGVLLLPAEVFAPIGGGVVQLVACGSLAELAFRRTGWPVWVGAVLIGFAHVANPYPPYPLAANVLTAVLYVAAPLLLGSYLRSQRRLAEYAEQRAAEVALGRARELRAVRAAERTAIARELHDVVAHHVSAIVLRVGAARHVAGRHSTARDGTACDGTAAEVLDDVHTIGGQALTDLRGLVAVLRDEDDHHEPAVSDPVAALAAVLERTRQAGVPVTAELDEDAVRALDTVHRLAVLRVVQEGLTNVLKHAGAGAAGTVAVRPDAAGLLVRISDDGGSPSPVPPGGHGLVVMRERVELLAGSFTAGPGEHGGWTVTALLPGGRVPG